MSAQIHDVRAAFWVGEPPKWFSGSLICNVLGEAGPKKTIHFLCSVTNIPSDDNPNRRSTVPDTTIERSDLQSALWSLLIHETSERRNVSSLSLLAYKMLHIFLGGKSAILLSFNHVPGKKMKAPITHRKVANNCHRIIMVLPTPHGIRNLIHSFV